MGVRLKRLRDQVMVITGASSGIGLSLARRASGAGAKVFVIARNRDAVDQLADEINRAGGAAASYAADVGSEDQVKAAARAAVERFGGFDTWVNNAGTAVYGEMINVTTEDSRRVFETNFWGTVYGSLEAARHFRGRSGEYGGALINVGSALSDRAVPLLGMYCASKHAMKGFTDSLRMELESAGVPVSVTLVKPSSVDTPFPQHGKNYMDEEPSLPPPVYTPDVVARAILHCAETPERDLTVGGGGKSIALLGQFAPRLADKVLGATVPGFLKKGEPPRDPAGALHAAGFGMNERGEYGGPVLGSSLYTTLATNPLLSVALAVGAGVAAAALLSGGSSDGRRG